LKQLLLYRITLSALHYTSCTFITFLFLSDSRFTHFFVTSAKSTA